MTEPKLIAALLCHEEGCPALCQERLRWGGMGGGGPIPDKNGHDSHACACRGAKRLAEILTLNSLRARTEMGLVAHIEAAHNKRKHAESALAVAVKDAGEWAFKAGELETEVKRLRGFLTAFPGEVPAALAQAREEGEKCWPWQGAIDKDGYGKVGKHGLAHRFIYVGIVGPIPVGKVIDHLCRNRACVNPKHMEIVTVKVNTLRGTSLAARNARRERCIRGHEFERIEPNGQRRCVQCKTASNRSYYKNRAALSRSPQAKEGK